jgi:hypothetical protein
MELITGGRPSSVRGILFTSPGLGSAPGGPLGLAGVGEPEGEVPAPGVEAVASSPDPSSRSMPVPHPALIIRATNAAVDLIAHDFAGDMDDHPASSRSSKCPV